MFHLLTTLGKKTEFPSRWAALSARGLGAEGTVSRTRPWKTLAMRGIMVTGQGNNTINLQPSNCIPTEKLKRPLTGCTTITTTITYNNNNINSSKAIPSNTRQYVPAVLTASTVWKQTSSDLH